MLLAGETTTSHKERRERTWAHSSRCTSHILTALVSPPASNRPVSCCQSKTIPEPLLTLILSLRARQAVTSSTEFVIVFRSLEDEVDDRERTLAVVAAESTELVRVGVMDENDNVDGLGMEREYEEYGACEGAVTGVMLFV